MFRSRAFPRPPCLGLILLISVCCFSVASRSLSLLPRVPAGVAVSSMSLATTEQVAQRLGWGRRGFALESAARVASRDPNTLNLGQPKEVG